MNDHNPVDAGVNGVTTEIDELPPAITGQEMEAALETGQARPLSRHLTDFVYYAGKWWVVAPDGWLRIDDPRLVAAIDGHSRRAGR